MYDEEGQLLVTIITINGTDSVGSSDGSIANQTARGGSAQWLTAVPCDNTKDHPPLPPPPSLPILLSGVSQKQFHQNSQCFS